MSVREPASPRPERPEPDPPPPPGWGLWPDHGEGRLPRGRELLHYWFIRYNPLYFSSALSVLAGVLLLSRALDAAGSEGGGADWARGQVTLFGVIQLYELLVVASAVFLARRAGARRAAVLLALLESVFLFDCTFRLESISQIGSLGVALSVLWAVLVPLKMAALARGIGVHLPAAALLLAAGAAAGLAAMLLALALTPADPAAVVAAAIWLGALLAGLATLLEPRLRWPSPLAAAEAAKLERIGRALLWVLVGFYYYHVVSYLLWAGHGVKPAFGPLACVAFLALALRRAREGEIWLAGVLGLGFATLHPPSFPVAAVALALVWLVRARALERPRLAVGAVLTLAAGGWAMAGGASPPAWVAVGAAAALGMLLWRCREPTAGLALVAGAAAYVHTFGLGALAVLPGTQLGWGILLVVVGFGALTGAVGVSWWLRPQPRSEGSDPLAFRSRRSRRSRGQIP